MTWQPLSPSLSTTNIIKLPPATTIINTMTMTMITTTDITNHHHCRFLTHPHHHQQPTTATATASVTVTVTATIPTTAVANQADMMPNSFNVQAAFQAPPAAGNTNILVTGALGQLGMALVNSLRLRYGADNVLATDIRKADAFVASHYLDGP
jgi:NADPH:quinone reductase-like Zn-dependent oxidoreductase